MNGTSDTSEQAPAGGETSAPSRHFTLKMRIPETDLESLEALLFETEQVGVEIRDSSLKPLPGAEKLPEGMGEAVAWFESEDAAREAWEWLKGELDGLTLAALNEVVDQDWTEKWKDSVRATRAGRIWVGPSWLVGEKPEECVGLTIDPGMAFGTGDHPTTAMCLLALDEWMAEAERAGRQKGTSRVLDVGTGSGVLAMAAKKLGAGETLALDIDPVAIQTARENAEKNEVKGVTWTTKPLERVRGTFDLVMANIFANVLCHYAPRLAAATDRDGRLLLTGILDVQAEEVRGAFEAEGMALVRRREMGEWVLLEMGWKA